MENKILLIEDDEEIRNMIKDYLTGEFEVCPFQNGKSAVESSGDYSEYLLALIDLMLPDMSGMEVIKAIRRISIIPIIIITAKDNDTDKSLGLNLGADDYVVKPFDLAVLHSRILALLRRTESAAGAKIVCDDLVLDKEKTAVFEGQREISISQSEYRILLMLMENKGKTVTRSQLLEQIWDRSGSYVNDNTLTVTMKRLREKLNNPACLKTIRSFGYRMEDTK